MKRRYLSMVPAGAIGFLLSISCLYAQEQAVRTAHLTSEQQLRVDVEGGFGKLLLRRGTADAAYTIKTLGREVEDQRVSVSYEVKDQNGVLHIEINTDSDDDGISDLVHLLKGKNTGCWQLELTDQIPIDYRMEFGAGEADLDFTGLRISNLALETGASSLTIRMKTPNLERIKSMTISAGLGSIHSEGLGNLNFDRFRFEGGLGSYKLDLSGAIRDGAKIFAEIGLGSLEVLLPENIGVRAQCDDSWLSSAHFHRFTRLDNERYETPNYSSASRRISMSLESGMGSISVRWKK